MIPLLVIAPDKKSREEFIGSFGEHRFHPSVTSTIMPVKQELSIDQIRSLKKELVYTTRQPRLFLIHDFDTASAETQNAMLKTLEEKITNNQFVMFVSNVERVLPTIRSRAQIRNTTVSIKQTLSVGARKLLDTFTQTPSLAIMGEVALSGISREEALMFFDSIVLYFRERLHTLGAAPVIMKKALSQKQLLQFNNLNPQLAVDGMLIYMKKQLQRLRDHC